MSAMSSWKVSGVIRRMVFETENNRITEAGDLLLAELSGAGGEVPCGQTPDEIPPKPRACCCGKRRSLDSSAKCNRSFAGLAAVR